MERMAGSIGIGSVLTFVAAFASAVVPIVIWQLDRAEQAIAVSVSSSVGLKPKNSAAIDGLEVTFGRERLSAPFLSAIEIAVVGAKPIRASAFESPLQITVGAGTKIVRATVEASAPDGIKPSLIVRDTVVEVLPLLLNSGDVISLAVLTDGDPPGFSAQARIAGVPKIEVKNAAGNKLNIERSVFSAIGGLTGLFLYFHFGFAAVNKSWSIQPSRATYIVAALFGAVVFLVLASSFETYAGIELSSAQKMAVSLAMFFVTYLPHWRRMRRVTRIQARRHTP